MHHRDFGIYSGPVLAQHSAYKNVSVLGGGKSAADLVYASIKAGKKVNWIIRTTGQGPGIFMDPAGERRYRHAAEAGATQKSTMLNPSSFHTLPQWAQSLHQSDSERSNLLERLYAADNRFKAWANYRSREGALPGFRNLEPKASFFWGSGPVGVIQQEDFWDLVSKQVNVYRGHPCGTSSCALILDDGREVPTDIVLCGTGWNPAYQFFSDEQACRLGLPHEVRQDSADEQHWTNLMAQADVDVLRQFPVLAKPPTCKSVGEINLTPARLYHGVASLSDPSIVFLGRARISNNFRAAEAQAIWATAYFDGRTSPPPLEQARREVAYMNALSRRRYPTQGLDGINFHGDLVWYTDKLVADAGLTSHRKDWWVDPEEPCLASDFEDCKEEYLAKYGPR